MEPSISGPDSTVWGSVAESNQHAADLIALSGRHKEDIFSKWVTDKLFVPFDKHIGKWVKKPDPRYNTRVYNDNFFLQITHLITSLIACSLPVTSIVILYFVTSMRARLAIVAGFNLLFTTCLFCLTTAKRNDIFAATAAWVQKRFKQTSLTSLNRMANKLLGSPRYKLFSLEQMSTMTSRALRGLSNIRSCK